MNQLKNSRSLESVTQSRTRKPKPGSKQSWISSSQLVKPTKKSLRTDKSCAVWSTNCVQDLLPRSTNPVVNSRWWRTSTTSKRLLRSTVSTMQMYSKPSICGRRRTSLQSPTPSSPLVVKYVVNAYPQTIFLNLILYL